MPKIKILDKRLENSLSASQVDTYMRCPVKWAWEKLNGEPRAPAGPAAAKGSAVHTILEDYLKDGKKIDITTELGKIAFPGLKHLPKPKIEHVEKYFTIAADDVPYVGYIDFVYEKDGLWIVGDHKTTSNFRYAKSVEDLQDNVQAMLYANYACEWLGVDRVRLNWVYYKTRGKAESRLVMVDVDKEYAKEQLVKINKIGKEMYELRNSETKAEDLEPNVDACMDFGGCPFLDTCRKRHPTWRKKMSEKLTLKEKLKLEKEKGKKIYVGSSGEVVTAEPSKAEVIKKTIKDLEKEDNVVKLGNKAKKVGFTLCVDCYPIKTDKKIILLNDYLKPVLKRIEEDTGLPHYKLMKYGEGAGLLAAELKVELDKNPPPAGSVIYIEVLGNVGKDCLDELEAAASQIYKRT